MTSLHTRRALQAAQDALEADLPDLADVRRTVSVPSQTGGTTRTPRLVIRDMPVDVRAGGGNITVTADQAESVTFLDVRAPLSYELRRGDELLVYTDADRTSVPSLLRVVAIIAPRSHALLQHLTARQVIG